jgi:hypothetical protein
VTVSAETVRKLPNHGLWEEASKNPKGIPCIGSGRNQGWRLRSLSQGMQDTPHHASREGFVRAYRDGYVHRIMNGEAFNEERCRDDPFDLKRPNPCTARTCR